MSAPADFRFFRYHPPMWSVGDRLELALETPDEPALARLLAPLGLEAIARTKIGGGMVAAFGTRVSFRAFGTTLEIVVGPEDRYTFLDATHFEQARRIEDALAQAGASPFVLAESVALPDDDPARTAPQRPRGDAWVLALDARTREGWTTRIVRSPRVPSAVTSIEIARDTSCEGALAPDALGRATLGVGRREDGAFGAIAARIAIFTPDDALVALVRRWREALAHLDVALDPPDAPTFAAFHLIERAEGHAAPIERSMGDALRFARHEIPPDGAGAGAAMVAVMRSLRVLGFPCLFNARATLARAGATFHAELVGEANRAAAAAGDHRRWRTMQLATETEPTTLLASEEEIQLLAQAGIVTKKA